MQTHTLSRGALAEESKTPEQKRKLDIALIGAPVDLGQNKPGVDMGPSALRFPDVDRNLVKSLQALGHNVQDLDDIEVAHRARLPVPEAGDRAKYLDHIIVASKRLAHAVAAAAEHGQFPIVLGGDHSVAIGSVAGMSSVFRRRNENLGLLWIDAHADMNTPEISPSGNVHGMPLACTIGMGPRELTYLLDYCPKVRPQNVVLIGVRDVDHDGDRDLDERRVVKKSGVHAFTMRDVDEMGIAAVMDQAIRIAMEGTAGFHVSFDIDFVDPSEAPGVGTPVPGGGTFREAHLIMETLSDSGCMTSLDMVEVNPVLDDRNRTAKLAMHLMLSAMGKSIL